MIANIIRVVGILVGAESILEQNPFWNRIGSGAESVLEQDPFSLL